MNALFFKMAGAKSSPHLSLVYFGRPNFEVVGVIKWTGGLRAAHLFSHSAEVLQGLHTTEAGSRSEATSLRQRKEWKIVSTDAARTALRLVRPTATSWVNIWGTWLSQSESQTDEPVQEHQAESVAS